MSDKKFLTADEIMAQPDIETIEVDVPEWGGAVRLRTLSGEDALRFVEKVGSKPGSAMDVVSLCAVNEDGSPLFTEEQWAQLKKKSMRALLRLQKAALKLNGLDESSVAAAKNA